MYEICDEAFQGVVDNILVASGERSFAHLHRQIDVYQKVNDSQWLRSYEWYHNARRYILNLVARVPIVWDCKRMRMICEARLNRICYIPDDLPTQQVQVLYWLSRILAREAFRGQGK